MIGFEVWLNGKKLATIGVGDLGVLSGMVTWVRRDVPKRYRKTVRSEELELTAGGLITDPKYLKENVEWVRKALTAGDRVSFRVVETEKIDAPARRQVIDPQAAEKGERRYFAYLKRKYGRPRSGRSRRPG